MRSRTHGGGRHSSALPKRKQTRILALSTTGAPRPKRAFRFLIEPGHVRHVWTAPLLQGFGNGVAVACGHVSGLYVRSVTAGLDGIRGSTPIQADGLESP
jgi:hypothetical protein